MFRRFMLPIVIFLLGLSALIFAPHKSANAQVSEDPLPGTIVPVVKLKVDMTVPEDARSGDDYELQVTVTNTGSISASVDIKAVLNATELTGVSATRPLTRTAIISHPPITTTLFTHVAETLKPGDTVTVTMRGW